MPQVSSHARREKKHPKSEILCEGPVQEGSSQEKAYISLVIYLVYNFRLSPDRSYADIPQAPLF